MDVKPRFYYTKNGSTYYYEKDDPIFQDDFVIEDSVVYHNNRHTKEEYMQALGGCERILKESPRHRLANLYRFVLLYKMQRYEEALDVFYDALSDDPDNQNDRAYWLKACILLELGRYKEAEWPLKRVFEIRAYELPSQKNEESDEAYENRGQAFYNRGRARLKAFRHSKEFLQLALNDLEAGASYISDKPYRGFAYAWALFLSERYWEAHLVYRELLSKFSTHSLVRLWETERDHCLYLDEQQEAKKKKEKKRWPF